MPLTDEQLRQRLAVQEWTAHNIRMSQQVATMPGKPDFMETDTRLQSIFRTLSLLYGPNLSGLRVADLGCLEGGFALAMAQRGMEVIAIEARQTNLEKAVLLKEHFDLPNLDFRRDDVKNFSLENYGSFDVVLCLGILYHLDDPVNWMRQAAAATTGLMFVDTHLAPQDDSAMALLDPAFSQLGPLQQFKNGEDTYEGRWYPDCSALMDRETQVWSSYSNSESIWLTRDSLCWSLVRAGFNPVFQQHDSWGDLDVYKFFSTRRTRGMFVAVKASAVQLREV